MSNQRLVGQAEVTARVIRRHAAFVTPEQVNLLPGNLVAVRAARQQAVERPRSGAPGEGYAESPARGHSLFHEVGESPGRLFGQGLWVL